MLSPADAISILRVNAGIENSFVVSDDGVDFDGRLGIAEAIMLLSKIAQPDLVYDLGTSNLINGDNTIIANTLAHFNYFSEYAWLDSKEYSMDDQEFVERFPYARVVHIMAAVGGNENRDGYIAFPTTPVGITFPVISEESKIVETCKNITAKGLIPRINLTVVPLALSDDPVIGNFEVNVRPPSNYDQWYNYIQSIITGLNNYCANNRDDLPNGVLDETHSTWWNTWLLDSRNFTEENYGGSRSRYGGYCKFTSTFIDNDGNEQDAQRYWKDNMSRHAETGVLYSETITIQDVANNELRFTIELPHHALYFYEIENIAARMDDKK